jgi:hypothetical protein
MSNHKANDIARWALIIVVTVLLSIICYYTDADAHEDHGFKHMVGGSGPIIMQDTCPTGITLWGIDIDSDGLIDKCTLVIFAHDVVHVSPAKIVLKEHYTGQLRPTCKCEQIDVYGGI